MSENPYNRDRLREQLTRLREAAGTRARLEEEISGAYEAEVAATHVESEAAIDAVDKDLAAQIESLRVAHAQVSEQARSAAADAFQDLEAFKASHTADIERTCKKQESQLLEDAKYEESTAKGMFEGKSQELARLLRKAEKELAAVATQAEEADAKGLKFLAEWGVGLPPAATLESAETGATATPEPPVTGAAALAAVDALRKMIDKSTAELVGLKSIRTAFAGGTLAAAIIVPLLLGLLAAGACFMVSPTIPAVVAAFIVVTGAGIGSGLWLVSRLKRTARAQAEALRLDVVSTLARIRQAIEASKVFVKQRHDNHAARLKAAFEEARKLRQLKLQKAIAAAHEARDRALAALEADCNQRADTVAKQRDTLLTDSEGKYPKRIAAIEADRWDQIARMQRERDERLATAGRIRDERWRAMTEEWRAAREAEEVVCREANEIDDAAFPRWEDMASGTRPLPTAHPPGLRFGQLSLSMEKIPGGVSKRPELNAFGPLTWTQPAIVPFPVDASMLIKTTGDQKEIASDMMQALMLRIATGIPPGQSRFTIIDPSGLGKQFAGFMHLADYDELLVTSRIWTEPPQIEQCLADITAQIELMIQKYLRNEFSSIGQYNASAEVPEPYRFVVIANFPSNFTETSARRLASIAESGPRCGVYTIVSVDTSQLMPQNFSLEELEKHATTLTLKNGVFQWKDPQFGEWPLTVERSPTDALFTEIVQRIGQAAKAAKRIEVPFDRVAPVEEKWWTGSTASEVVAPLGPAGAKKIQEFKLGKGTSQHALIAGKTGSGKSTLLHTLITSLALNYSPNEIQFYLIDFKKGVEFKLYDLYKLPHARVIAIESEREFGLSVLEQLDRELKRRGDLFREFSVQDVAGFRQSGHPDPMPRILLIIDEFQEIFVEDDKVAQDAALILDRLVRQGRAFGMHVILGSQTLGGSYSLPRATMGQMAIRVALQCNESDSSLILSEENTAARLLTRPGEAIYNDANGMVDGNNLFQVVFLNDERRERYLGALKQLAARRTDIQPLPRIVFDGNEAAAPAGNALLAELLRQGTVNGKLCPPLAWLGDAIAIKDPTAAIFRRQGAANLLIVGQREDLGASLLAMSLVSLAAGHDPYPGGALGRAARFVLLEPAIAEEKPDLLLASLGPRLPHDVELVGRLGVSDAIQRLADEVRRRIDEQVLDGDAVYVIIRDLARFRELRRDESDFGYSAMGGEQKATPAQNLVTLLKDGPPVGIHALIWCDSLTNLQRTFERGAMKEFELRVLFQMSSSDSSQLIDSPAAVKLGPQRALFVHEETATLEKFRPYAFPAGEWLESATAAMRSRPQGTPKGTPKGTPSGPPPARPESRSPAPAESRDSFDFKGFGADEFNFAKLLDDPPGEGGPSKP